MTKEKIGAEIKKARLKNKVSFYRFRKDLGVTQQQVEDIENCNSDYTFCTLLKVAKYLNVTISAKIN